MNAHILIVDDDNRVTNALRRTLAYEGYQVSVAMDGEGALAIARTKPPDVVILDLIPMSEKCDKTVSNPLCPERGQSRAAVTC